jgi:energy-coupling factor transporter ATP-binding protein EcfA2
MMCFEQRRPVVNDEDENIELPDHAFAGYENLLNRFGDDAVRSGLIGETFNVRLVFLVAVSARLSKPLHVVITGPRGSGKSYLMHTVAKFLPGRYKRVLTGVPVSELRQSGGAGLRHRALFIDDCAEYPDCGFPAAFIQTTACKQQQLEERPGRLVLTVNESPERAMVIRTRQEREAAGEVRPPDRVIYTRWHRYLLTLKAREVAVPCIYWDTLPSDISFETLIGLVQASAFLHQYRRYRDGYGRVMAGPEDFQMIQSLIQKAFRGAWPQSSRETGPPAQEVRQPGPPADRGLRWFRRLFKG